METDFQKKYRNNRLLYTVTDFGLEEEWYPLEDVARLQTIADQWRIITYSSFSEQRILKGAELLKAVYEHRHYEVEPISYSCYAIRNGEL